ncbi:MAG TPA: molybdenum cofactor guanylyltransferase [Oceanithermus profundus]|uniref:Probable molybdenum cofactor guanylyltransferase n=1 Tax=Oceanithermus profundus TaxID=187137 RepID=A0A7C4VDT3_9DEIN|nr:molybdenum cofactor guanylyltransferase [Oceanithermus profundus]
MEFSGAVLAGGRSERFGQDKARFVWRGRPLAEHVLASLARAGERFLVANRPYPEFGVPVHADVIPGGDSLSGLHSALVHARFDWVAVAACDLPYLSPEYWAFMSRAAGRTHARAVVAEGPTGWIEPLAAFYRKDLEPAARTQLEAGDLFLKHLVEAAEAEIVPWSELAPRFGARLFLNANRLEDLVGGADEQASG